MNLIKTLQSSFDKRTMNKIVAYIGNDPTKFDELVAAFLNSPYRITQRAAWPLSSCVKAHPELVRPHLKMIIKNLAKPGIHDAVKRNTLRFLQFIEIPKPLHGITLDICFPLVQNVKEPVAIRVFAMTVVANLCEMYPELRGELTEIIDKQMPYASAGFRSRGVKILRKLK